MTTCSERAPGLPARVVICDDSSEDARRAGELGALLGAGRLLARVYPQVLKGSREVDGLESRIVDHAPGQAESELANRVEGLASVLGSRPGVSRT